MELWLALTLRDLGFLLYGGPLIAFAVVISLSSRIPGLSPWAAVRTFRAWGPGLGLSLGAAVAGGLAAHWLAHGSFTWAWDTPRAQVELAAWLAFFAVWVSNIRLEVWTLHSLRALDADGEVSDTSAYRTATGRLSRHLVGHAVLILAVTVLARLAEAPWLRS